MSYQHRVYSIDRIIEDMKYFSMETCFYTQPVPMRTAFKVSQTSAQTKSSSSQSAEYVLCSLDLCKILRDFSVGTDRVKDLILFMGFLLTKIYCKKKRWKDRKIRF